MKPSDHVNMRESLFGKSGESESSTDQSKMDRTEQLLYSRNEMRAEFDRLRSTADVIESSSKTIGSVNEKYSLYRAKLLSAGQALKSLKNKMENDDKYIYYSFVLFLLVAGYICVRRLGVVAVTRWVTIRCWTIIVWLRGMYNDWFTGPLDFGTDVPPPVTVAFSTSYPDQLASTLPIPVMVTTRMPPMTTRPQKTTTHTTVFQADSQGEL